MIEMDAEAKLGALSETARTPGFALLCAEFGAEIAHLNERIFDLTTEDNEANQLRRTRAVLIELAPRTFIERLQKAQRLRASNDAAAITAKQ